MEKRLAAKRMKELILPAFYHDEVSATVVTGSMKNLLSSIGIVYIAEFQTLLGKDL